MVWFADSKIKKAEENLQVTELIPFLRDKSEDVARKATDAFLRVAIRVPKLPAPALKELQAFTKHSDPLRKARAWRAILRTADPQWLDQMVENMKTDCAGPVAEVAIQYFDELREKHPVLLRSHPTVSELILACVRNDLAGEVNLCDPKVRRAFNFVELYQLWNNQELSEKTLGLLQNIPPKADPTLVELLTDAMVRVHPEQMTQLLLALWETDALDKSTAEKMIDRIKAIGKPAIPFLLHYVSSYRAKIKSQRSVFVEKGPEYEVSRWSIYLLGELALLGDQQITDFLLEIAVDTKLASTGWHRKNAREALEKISVRAA